jgi:oxygen-dependent protoporphyrinogen oxidase
MRARVGARPIVPPVTKGAPLTSNANPGKKKIIVVGAGIGGLSSAYYANRRGHDVTVLEASDRVGGRMISWRVNGDRVDAGAQFFHSNFRNIRKLIKELGLADRVTPITLAVQIARKDGPPFVTKTVFGIVRSLGLRGILSLARFFVRYVLFGRRFSLFTIETEIGEYDDCRASEKLAGINGRVYEYVMRPVALGECATIPEESNFYQFLNCFRLAAGTTHFTLPGGVAELTDALAERLDVRCQKPVKSLIMEKGRVLGVGLESGERLSADHVILATTLGSAAAIVPEELGEIRDFLIGFPHVSNPMVFFFLDRRLNEDIACYMSPSHLDLKYTMAIDHANKVPSMVPSGNSILSAWAFHPMGRELIDRSDEELIRQAVSDLDHFVPSFKEGIRETRVIRHRWMVARYAPGTHRRIIEFKRRVESVEGLSIVSNDLDSCHMESAVTAARRTVESLSAG